jgi:hypothetical protein
MYQHHDDTCPQHDDNKTKTPYCPFKALSQVIVDGIVIAVSYVFLSCALDKCSSVNTNGVITFFSVFIPLGFFLRTMDLEYQETLGRVAMFQIGTKIFNSLTML